MEQHCRRAGVEVDRIRSGTDWNVVRQELAGTSIARADDGSYLVFVERIASPP